MNWFSDIWGNLGSILAEYPHLGTICHREAEAASGDCHAGRPLEVFRKTGKPAVFVSAHLANWELAAGDIASPRHSTDRVYTGCRIRTWTECLYRARQSLGCGMVERDGAGRKLMSCLKQGTSVGLLSDQRVDSGEPVPFFGRDMLTTITPARLALRFDCELIPVQVQRLKGARFRIIFHPAVTADDGNRRQARTRLPNDSEDQYLIRIMDP